MGKLERKLDLELIARLAAGVKVRPQPVKHVIEPRSAHNYRGAIRNLFRQNKWKNWRGAKAGYIGLPAVSLNRSRHLPQADNYAEARAVSAGIKRAAE